MIKNYANKVMDYEYNAFMTLMNVSVSKHLFDEHFTVLWANDYFYELIGYSKEEYELLFHNHVDEYYRDDPDAVALMAKIIVEAYEKQEGGYEFECPMQTKDRGIAWIRVTGRFTDELFEGIPVIYTIYTDITKLKNMQQQLEEQSTQLMDALDMAEKANRAKSEFLSQMSHDIRTPMNAIIGMTNIASMHIGDQEKIEDCLKKISSSSQHLLGLINDVLDMSKIESGNIALNLESISLPAVLEEVVTIMQPVVKGKEQDFSIRLHNVHHEDLLCDSLRLRQIFINILSNASKFTPEGGSIVFEITELISDEPGTARFQFMCTDSGIGIRPEFLPNLFDAFTRERDSRVDQTEGSGLGLAIAKKLTELFGGTITVESQLGKGSAFSVVLPMRITSHEERQNACTDLNILVVDNDRIACEYLVQTLDELGAHAVWTDNGSDAVDQVLQLKNADEGFDAVLLDWKMPGMDGIRTAQAIRQVVGRDLPIILTSAYDWSDIRDEIFQDQIDGFLQKPLFKSSLCDGIQRYVLKGQHYQENERLNSLAGRMILLVEDNQLNLEIAVELLTMMGTEVEIAEDGQIAVQKVSHSAEGYYDVILMDVQMPNMNGYEATRRIRALPREDVQNVPIIAMTADAFSEDVEAAKKAGMNSHLAKPFTANSLNREILKVL